MFCWKYRWGGGECGGYAGSTCGLWCGSLRVIWEEGVLRVLTACREQIKSDPKGADQTQLRHVLRQKSRRQSHGTCDSWCSVTRPSLPSLLDGHISARECGFLHCSFTKFGSTPVIPLTFLVLSSPLARSQRVRRQRDGRWTRP